MTKRMTKAEAKAAEDTNPKSAFGALKVQLGLLSPVAKAWWALAMYKGRLAYGAWNYRGTKVAAMEYASAAQRHIDAYVSGEEFDEDGLHHLGAAMACCSILLDAAEGKTLVDDRPPFIALRPVHERVQARMADVLAKYKDREPRHYTIEDAK